ncbi:MAG: quinone-dependent dihydroorotate dehydrogenase [Hyphomicrobiaceae bacterium]
MLDALITLARPCLFALQPETAHEVTLKALERGLFPRRAPDREPRLAIDAMGLHFPNPLGIAAGFDKDARVPDAILGMGFGFAEIGTVTPKAQQGNPQPRIFRLIEDRAIINRLGFNNGGHAPAFARLSARRQAGIVGVNVGANKDSADRIADYVEGLERFWGVASYFVVNISSPNTPGLRDLQAPAALDALLEKVMAARAALIAAGGPHRPIVLKIAPDIAEADLPAIIERTMAHRVDAIAVSNTTLSRTGVRDSAVAKQAGGLSGPPLFARSTAVLGRVYRLTGGRVPLIGIGGIGSGETALAKLEAGASLLQLYTALVYHGPALVGQICAELSRCLDRDGLTSISQVVGRAADHWAEMPFETTS